ncbi:dehydrogenase E1 component subunit alpha/beta [Chryseobacterium nepalense]|uniref:Thiamine pyrophosphate-dependent enzyme n=1 Tax=Chryseobacterium nepalense TaxID=1854498 RepID=A0ABY4K3S0_9FLAO|nr:alpha-ketoacid dehydrogenase subunit alpha/beta [Chryseobacterium nepalense]UPQ75429.1 thiamine pyrophosphate-dependent enzyme [Chryseobacterium nepalense]
MNYTKAILIREFEKLLLDQFSKGTLNGTVHTCVGQETIAVAISENFKKGDKVFSNHRGHGHFISVGGDVKLLLAEMLGKKCGISSGIGGSQHLYNDNFISNGIQGGLAPVAVGYAYVNKLKNNDNISIVFLGDGTMGEGVVYEALNLAAIYSSPTLFVMENNGYAQSTPFKMVKKGEIKNRVEGFGVTYLKTSIWASDFEKTVHEAIVKTREGQPVFLEIECYRLNSHSKGDDNRDTVEIERYVEIDPINVFYKEYGDKALEYESSAKELLYKYLEELSAEESLSTMKKHLSIYNKKIDIEKFAIEKLGKRINKLINEGLDIFLAKENSLFLGEDIMQTTEYTPGNYGGAFKVSEKLSEKYKNRVFNTPICESSIIGFAIGSSLNGYKSIAEIMFGDFMTLAFDQILQQGSKIPEMFGQKVELPMIIRTPMGGRRGYGPTHSQNIEKHFLFIPNTRVLALNSFYNPKNIFESLYQYNDILTLIIEDKISYTKEIFWKDLKGYEIYQTREEFPTLIFSPAKINPNLTILCYGGMLDEVLASIDDLIAEEIFPEIICAIQISPFNINRVVDSIGKTKNICIVEEGSKYAGLSGEIFSYFVEHKIEIDKALRISNESLIPCAKEAELATIPNKNIIFNEIKNFFYE